MPEAERVGLASCHLEGNTQPWFLQLESDFPSLTWDNFKHHYHLRFGPPIQSHKLGELSKLRQIGSIVDYQERIEQLASRADLLTQEQKIELYISGLKDYISIEVELQNPSNLATTMSLSRLYEHKSNSLHSFDTHKSNPPDPPPQSSKTLLSNYLDQSWKIKD